MSRVFRLQGSDVYRVDAIERVPGAALEPPPRRNLLAAVRDVALQVAACADLAELVDAVLAALDAHLGFRHSMLLMADPVRRRLYTVATRGYRDSGVGAEIAFGDGVIGVAARERVPIRIMHRDNDWGYGRAIRDAAVTGGLTDYVATEIPLPGLAESRSQLAVPVIAANALVAVLFVEDVVDRRFDYDDEDALVAVSGLLGPTIRSLQACADSADDDAPSATAAARVEGAPLPIRHYGADDSVFLGDDYLIKGVAGAILWKLVGDFVRKGRTEFSNRELRLDTTLGLPDIADNLEARLILLQRRLAERSRDLAIEKTGRGRFRLRVLRPVQMHEVAFSVR